MQMQNVKVTVNAYDVFHPKHIEMMNLEDDSHLDIELLPDFEVEIELPVELTGIDKTKVISWNVHKRRPLEEPSLTSPHRNFYEHLKNGGKIFRDDKLNGIQEVIGLYNLDGIAANIQYFGYLDLTCI